MSAISWSAVDRHSLAIGTQEIERGIEQDELFVVYRPQARLIRTNDTPRVEALLRWRHPRWGVLTPERFMPHAAHAGLGTTLTEWLVTAALRQARSWRRAGDDIDLSIDLWPGDLHRYLPGTIAAALGFSGAAPSALTCEIPQSAVAADPARAANVAAELSWLGVRVSLDRFGKSDTTFAPAHTLHLDELKLASELVADLEVSADRAALAVIAVVSAQALGIEVVACGVLSDADLAAVRALGCDAAEGPAISPPLDAAATLGWLRARSHEG